MAKQVKAGRVEIDVAARLDNLDRSFKEGERRAEAAGRKIAAAVDRGGQSGRGGRALAERFLDQLERTFDRDVKRAKEKLFRGLIDEKEYERRAGRAADRFNKGLLNGLDRMRAGGKITDRLERQLVGEMKEAGLKAGVSAKRGILAGLTDAWNGVQGLFIGLAAWTVGRTGKMLFDLGSSVEETASKYSTVFGESAAAVDDFHARWAKGAGITRREAKDTASVIGAIAQGMKATKEESAGFSIEVQRLAGDLQSFHNIPIEETFNALRSGLTGETEPLKRFGIVLKQTDAEARALALTGKKNADALSEWEIAQARLSIIIEQAGVANGDLERTWDSNANKARRIGTVWRQMREDLAVGLMPAFADLVDLGEQNERTFQSLGTAMGAVVRFGVVLTEAIFDLGDALTIVLMASAAGAASAFGTLAKGIAAVLSASAGLAKKAGADGLATWLDERAAAANASAVEQLRAAEALREEGRATWGDMKRRHGREKRTGADGSPAPVVLPPGGDNADVAADRAAARIAEEIEQAVERLQSRTAEFQLFQDAGLSSLPETPKELPAILTQVLQLDREIAAIEKEIAAARGQAPAGAKEMLAAYQAQRDAAATAAKEIQDRLEGIDITPQLARTVGIIRDVMVSTAETGAVPLTDAIDDVAKATRAVQQAELDLQAAYLSGDREKIKAGTRELEQAEKRAAAAAAAGMRILEAGLAQGVMSQEQLNEAIREMVKLLGDAGVEIDAATDGKNWKEIAQTIEGVARGVLSIADALGVLDDSSRKVLQGTVDMASGAARLVASGGTDIGAWVQTLGGALQAGSALFGGDVDAEANRKAMRDLQRSIEQLNETILHDMTTREVEADRAAVGSAAANLADEQHRNSRHGYKRRRSLAYLAEEMGLGDADNKEGAIAALEDWAAELDAKYGTNLAQFVANSDANGFLKALQALEEQLGTELGEMGTFGDDVAGIFERINWQFRILGKEDPAERIQAITSAIIAAGHDLGEFADEFAALQALDLSTEEGRKERDRIIAEMTEQGLAGGADFGDLSPEEWRQLLEEWSTAAPGDGETETWSVNRSVTEVTGSRLVGYLATIAHWTEAMARALSVAGAGTGPTPAAEGIAPPAGALSAEGPSLALSPVGAPRTGGAGGTVVHVDLSGMQVQVSAGGGSPAELRDGGRAFGAGIAAGLRGSPERIDQQLGQRLRDLGRAQGNLGR